MLSRSPGSRSGPVPAPERATHLANLGGVENGSVNNGGGHAPPAPDQVQVEVCPRFHSAVELIGRRWSGVIISVLLERPHYFAELKSTIPEISDRLLSARLRELEAAAVVQRCVHEGTPARVSYAVTDHGRALEPALRELQGWARSDWPGLPVAD